MEIRLKIDDILYDRYKELAEKNAFAVTRLNQMLFEQALRQWIIETENKEVVVCATCGRELDYELDDNDRFLILSGNAKYILCQSCFKRNNPHLE